MFGKIYLFLFPVYYITKRKKVTEDLTLVPISTYNKTNLIAERIILSYQKIIMNLKDHYSLWIISRMRYFCCELLTMQAINYKKIVKAMSNYTL